MLRKYDKFWNFEILCDGFFVPNMCLPFRGTLQGAACTNLARFMDGFRGDMRWDREKTGNPITVRTEFFLSIFVHF